jgi:integrase
MVVFMSETGLRPQEVTALEHSDVDRSALVAFVRRVYAGGRVKEPKTERSRRPTVCSRRRRARRWFRRLVGVGARGEVAARRENVPPYPGDSKDGSDGTRTRDLRRDRPVLAVPEESG